MNDGVSIRDALTYELIDANPRFCEMYGYTLEELKALPLGSLNARESVQERRERLVGYYTQTAEGISNLIRAEARRKDGGTFWIEANVRRITVKDRECLLGAVRDITKRIQAEEALKRSEEAALRFAGETSVIAEIGSIISSNVEIDEVYERFAEAVRKLIDFDRIVINLLNRKKDTLTTAYTVRYDSFGQRAGRRLPC